MTFRIYFGMKQCLQIVGFTFHVFGLAHHYLFEITTCINLKIAKTMYYILWLCIHFSLIFYHGFFLRAPNARNNVDNGFFYMVQVYVYIPFEVAAFAGSTIIIFDKINFISQEFPQKETLL